MPLQHWPGITVTSGVALVVSRGAVGAHVGNVGDAVGHTANVGAAVGPAEGRTVGLPVGGAVGRAVGLVVGLRVGAADHAKLPLCAKRPARS